MKKIVSIISILAFVIFSCSKNDPKEPVVPVVYPEENPMMVYMTASGFGQSTASFLNLNDNEMGFSFRPEVTGKINAVLVKIPVINNAVRVTIWDKTSKIILRTETVDVTTANTEITKIITPLYLTKKREYLISINTNSWYTHTKTDGSTTIYPIIAGNITITGSQSHSDITQTLPNVGWFDFYRGDVSFVFQQTI